MKCILLWQELSDQLVCLVSLDLQFVRSFSDQILQVRAVLLQHPQHGVDDVRSLPSVDAPKLQTQSTGQIFSGIQSEQNIPVPCFKTE